MKVDRLKKHELIAHCIKLGINHDEVVRNVKKTALIESIYAYQRTEIDKAVESGNCLALLKSKVNVLADEYVGNLKKKIINRKEEMRSDDNAHYLIYSNQIHLKLKETTIIEKQAKPFLKWAGGKTQLIPQIEKQLPINISSKPFTYIEPFVGSGAILFWMLNKFPNLERAVINDINTDLTNLYLTIKNQVQNLIEILKEWEMEYHNFSDNQELKKEYYYKKRTLFNNRKSCQTTQSALFVFLNRTCFNGLFRVNRNNKFNVPIGSYKKPQICNERNLLAVSEALQRVEILNEDYSKTLQYANGNVFFYLDPPYKPLSETSSFNSYSKYDFNDSEQIRLKEFCDTLNKQSHQWILSNSDVKGKDPNNNFFDDLYSYFNILRVNARRSINANPSKRGELTELLIKNI